MRWLLLGAILGIWTILGFALWRLQRPGASRPSVGADSTESTGEE